jgi:hypothetical protein
MSLDDAQEKIETWRQDYNDFLRIHQWLTFRQRCLPSNFMNLNPTGFSKSGMSSSLKRVSGLNMFPIPSVAKER